MKAPSNGLPWWLPLANRVVMLLSRWGLAVGSQHILTIPGRSTGIPRSTPVALLYVDGARYIVSALESEWAKNARAAGSGLLSRGRRAERVRLVELPVDQRGPVLREFPKQVRGGVQFFKGVVEGPITPDVLAAAAPQCPVFRIER